MKYFLIVLTSILILLLIFIFLSFNATIAPIEGRVKDDWRIWWNTKVLGSKLISNFEAYEPESELLYFYNPLEWNEDGISRVSYKSCMSIKNLVLNYHDFLSKGEWARKDYVSPRSGLRTVSFESNGGRSSLLLWKSKGKCTEVIYTEVTYRE